MTTEVEQHIESVEYVVYANDDTDTIIRWAVLTLNNGLVLTGTPRINSLRTDIPDDNERVAYLNAIISVHEYFRCINR